jgi:hypothetical protein
LSTAESENNPTGELQKKNIQQKTRSELFSGAFSALARNHEANAESICHYDQFTWTAT